MGKMIGWYTQREYELFKKTYRPSVLARVDQNLPKVSL